MDPDAWEELVAQVESHGPESVIFFMTTDDGDGQVMVTDVSFTDNRIEVRLA